MLFSPSFKPSLLPKIWVKHLLCKQFKLTDGASISVALVVRLINENIARVVHPVELHELVHELESDQTLRRLVNFLAKWVLPEEGAILAVLGFLLFDNLKN